MLALSPPSFPTPGCSLGEHISHEQQSTEVIELDYSASFATHGDDTNMVKKLNHNASERDRRKKINNLYCSLRSLLPATDQTKKLSIPATVSRVLKYIPELQQQVERLVQRKEELLSKISSQHDLIHQAKQGKGTVHSSLLAISASKLNDREVVIQISTYKDHKSPLSEILLNLEENGLVLINSSALESFGGKVFYSLHLQVEGAYKLECEALSQKLVSMYETSEALFIP